MSDKNQPKEIFICGNKLDNIYLLEKMSIYDIKYISSTHHNEIVEGLKDEIESLKDGTCKCDSRIGETKLWCCNQCGKRTEEF